MACFLVSAAVAAGTAVTRHIVKHNEKKGKIVVKKEHFGSETKWSDKLKYLEYTLWGGSFLLAGEHIIHGEVTPFPPFLTAASSAEDTAEMLHEMGTVGVTMMLLLVAAWAAGVFIWDLVKYRKRHENLLGKKA